VGRETKQRLADQIAAHLGIHRDRLGPGSKEHRGLLSGVALALGLAVDGRKPELAKRIILHLGQGWDRDCTSSGDTVTGEALVRILSGLRQRRSDKVEVTFYEAVTASRKRQRKQKSRPGGSVVPKRLSSMSETFARSSEVVAWILEQARGTCEFCGKPAPFSRDDGTPFLEVHHVMMLREGGPDIVDNAIALCPNCHRKAHYGCDVLGMTKHMQRILARRPL